MCTYQRDLRGQIKMVWTCQEVVNILYLRMLGRDMKSIGVGDEVVVSRGPWRRIHCGDPQKEKSEDIKVLYMTKYRL